MLVAPGGSDVPAVPDPLPPATAMDDVPIPLLLPLAPYTVYGFIATKDPDRERKGKWEESKQT